MEHTTVMYRWLAIVLAIALLCVVVLWINARNDLGRVTQDFRGGVEDYRAEIAETCTFTATTTQNERRECEELLEEFSDVLRDYRNIFVDMTGTSTVPTSTPATTTMSTSESF
jgi:hypothetical protein